MMTTNQSGQLVVEATTCACHLPLTLPDGDQQWWWPGNTGRYDRAPRFDVEAVMLWGEMRPTLRWFQRVSSLWLKHGSLVAHPETAVPQSWSSIGKCWAGTDHPVVNVTKWFKTQG